MIAPNELSLPDPATWSLKGVVAAYEGWLEVKAPEHKKAFVRRRSDDPEPAHAEAVTFNLLRVMRKNPFPGEVLGKGGVDFVCTPKADDAFAVEVTVLKTDAECPLRPAQWRQLLSPPEFGPAVRAPSARRVAREGLKA